MSLSALRYAFPGAVGTSPEPQARALSEANVEVWYDEKALKLNYGFKAFYGNFLSVALIC
jgi:hypothetical protein